MNFAKATGKYIKEQPVRKSTDISCTVYCEKFK